jgi:glycine betaine/proline transport system ATP-binding protein
VRSAPWKRLAGWLDTSLTSRHNEPSGRLQQRVGLARALAVDPSMIIMDEAFSALDPPAKRREMQDAAGTAEDRPPHHHFVSHAILKKPCIGTRIVMEGRWCKIGTPQELIEPCQRLCATFFNTATPQPLLTAGQLMANSVPIYVNNGIASMRKRFARNCRHWTSITLYRDEHNNFQGSISLERIALLVEGGSSCGLDSAVLNRSSQLPKTPR